MSRKIVMFVSVLVVAQLAAVFSTTANDQEEMRKQRQAEYYQRLRAGEITLDKVPVEMRTPLMCKVAVRKDFASFIYVPTAFRDRELSELAVQGNGMLLAVEVPREVVDVPLCLVAARQNPDVIAKLPVDCDVIPFYLEAVKIGGRASELAFERLEYMRGNPAIFRPMVEKDGMTLALLPPRAIDRSLAEAAVKQNPLALQHVPWNLRDRQLCLLALRDNNDAKDFVPWKLFLERP